MTNTHLFLNILANQTSIRDCQWDTDSKRLVWVANQGNLSLLQSAACGEPPLTHSIDYTIRGRIGYGGGDFGVAAGQVVFVANGRLYKTALAGGQPHPITPSMGDWGAPTLDASGRWVVAVWQYNDARHLVICDTNNHFLPQRLTRHADFYMQPTFHPSGQWLAWVEWNHPNMPWSGSWLQLAQLDYPPAQLPRLRQMQTVAGQTNHAVFQPCFSPDGRWLAYCSDASGWAEIYVRDLKDGDVRQLTHSMVDHDTPAWVQGLRTIAWRPDSQVIYAVRNCGGQHTLWAYSLDGQAKQLPLSNAYTQFEQLAVQPHSGQLAYIASGSQQPARLVWHEPDHAAHPTIIIHTTAEPLLSNLLSHSQAVQWQTSAGQPCHGWLTLPKQHRPKGVIIHIHGGPTSHANTRFQFDLQLYAQIGWSVLQVNYRGSTGHGWAYRSALAGEWGVLDVADVLAAAQWLHTQGFTPEQTVVMGNSSGGLTALLALTQAPSLFAAVITAYPVTNLFALAQQTHAFEAHYTDWLIGELPDAAPLFQTRSPVSYVTEYRRPLLIFQGESDDVVPEKQTTAFVQQLRQRGCPVEYVCFAEEGHGWRKSETQLAYYQHITTFLARLF